MLIFSFASIVSKSPKNAVVIPIQPIIDMFSAKKRVPKMATKIVSVFVYEMETAKFL
jgi:hypothetical protein